jgi:hypothetical protein
MDVMAIVPFLAPTSTTTIRGAPSDYFKMAKPLRVLLVTIKGSSAIKQLL